MSYAKKVFLMDRETLHEAVGPQVNRNDDMLSVMERLKGKEVTIAIKDENFALVKVRGFITDKLQPKSSRIILEDWKGNKLPEPWFIRVIELVE